MVFNSTDHSFAKKMDLEDPLKNYRSKFVINNPNEIYLNGNSLGPLPIKTKEKLEDVINKEWGERLVRSWQEGWFELSEKVAGKIAKIIGAKEDEVVVSDSTSVNLYKLVYAALAHQKGRTKVVSDEFNFPSDLYVLQGIVDQHFSDHNLELIKSNDQVTIDIEDVEKSIDENTALVILSHVCFKSSFFYNIKEVTKLAHEKGALVLWDLSHSAGVVDFDLNEADVDLAIGCTYKYLNSGPGAPAYLFVKKELQEKLQMPIWGWFAHENPFEFSLEFTPVKGMKKFQVGTPPIISLSAIDASVDLILDAGIENIRRKSVLQTDYLIFLAQKILLPLGFKLFSPTDNKRRGSHVAFVKEDAYSIAQTIKYNSNDTSVIFDFRKPGIIRLSVNPLYNTYEELWKTVNIIEHLVINGGYKTNEEINGVT